MLKIAIWVVIAILALSFFGVSLQELVQDPQTEANFDFLWDLVKNGWHLLTDWIGSLRDLF